MSDLIMTTSLRSSTVPNLEGSEVSFESERSADDGANLHMKRVVPNHEKPAETPRQDVVSVAIPSYEIAQHAIKTLQSIKSVPFPSSPFFYAMLAGLLLPNSWVGHVVMYGFLCCIMGLIGSVLSKWTRFYGNDRDIIRFRRTMGGLIRRFSKELEMTLNGNFSRQVMASCIWVISTAPGESFISAFLRYETSLLNKRFIEEIDSMRDRFYGYERVPKKLYPFS